MLKLFSINSVPYGSTGKIAIETKKATEGNGNAGDAFFGFSGHPISEIKDSNSIIGSKFDKACHMMLSKVCGLHGCFSLISTFVLLKKIKRIKPLIIHLHNLHGWYINIPMLFKYIKKNKIKTVWTLHDCWAFTGHCPHFDMIGCEKWKSGCYECPQYREYPHSLVDNSKTMYRLKKKWFTGVEDMTIVTPSKWLAGLVKESFLKDYPVKVINNGIDLSVFKYTESNFKGEYNCADKFVLLGVAFGWGKRKGLDVFIELAKRLDERFQIVLVGTDDNVDKQLPDNIISIHRTQNQQELAEIYSAADLFVNPTREDNYPTVNMESLACGTPVVTFNTGGSPEMPDATCGSVVDKDDVDGLYNEILKIHEEKPYSKEACITRAQAFDMNERFEEYVRLYEGN